MVEKNLLIHPEALHCLQRKQLVSLCRRMDVKATGKNSELIERLQAFANTTIKSDSPSQGALIVLRDAEQETTAPLNIPKRTQSQASTMLNSPIKTRATRSKAALASSEAGNVEADSAVVAQQKGVRRASAQRKASAATSKGEKEEALASTKSKKQVRIQDTASTQEDLSGQSIAPRAPSSRSKRYLDADGDESSQAPCEPSASMSSKAKGRAAARMPSRGSRRKVARTVSAMTEGQAEATFAEPHSDPVPTPAIATSPVPLSTIALPTAEPSLSPLKATEPTNSSVPSLPLPSAEVSMDLDFELLHVPSNAPSGTADYGTASFSEFGAAAEGTQASPGKSVEAGASPTKESPFKSMTGSLRSIANALGLSPTKADPEMSSAGTKRKAEDDDNELDDRDTHMPGGMPSAASPQTSKPVAPMFVPATPLSPAVAGRVIKPRPSRAARQSSVQAPAPVISPRRVPPTLGSPLPSTSTITAPTATDQEFSDATSAVLASLNERLIASGRAPTTLTLDKVAAAAESAGNSPVPGSIRIVPRKAVIDQRFKETHDREFEKMDSIANHWAAKRPAQGLFDVEEMTIVPGSGSGPVTSPQQGNKKRVKLSTGEAVATTSLAAEEEAERAATRHKLLISAQRRRSGVAPRLSAAARAARTSAGPRKPAGRLGGAFAGVKGRVVSATKGLFGGLNKGKSSDAAEPAATAPAPKKKHVFDLKASLSRKPKGYTPYSLKDALAGHTSTSLSKASSTSTSAARSTPTTEVPPLSIGASSASSSSTAFPKMPTPLSPAAKSPPPASRTMMSPTTVTGARRPRIDPARFVAQQRQTALGVAASGALTSRRSLAAPPAVAESALLSPPAKTAGTSKVRASMPGPRARAAIGTAGGKAKSSVSRAMAAGSTGRSVEAAAARAAARTRVNAGLSPTARRIGGAAGTTPAGRGSSAK